ncbi:unnamed protein product [Prorocentrum cordatum]|nr:unnamed protein product [Polarella glacialis]
MVVGVIREWFEALKEDMRRSGVKADDWRNSAKPPMKSLGSELLMIGREAKSDERLKESWDAWQGQMQEKTRSLSQAVDDWARDNSMQTALSFRGFIGDSGLNPIVDAYELLVRLEHLVARLRVMADSSQVTRPCDLLPHPLLVGPATAAACFHFMRKQGVVLVLDCTSDLPPPAEAALGSDIRWRRLPLEDAEDQELSGAFDEGLRAIDEAVAAGGRALVHCHEGRSRSVSLCLAYLVVRERMALADAMALVKARRPLARPNAGFWRQLMELELATLGSCSVSAADAPRGKPKAFVCSICGETAGLTEAALAGHMRLKHKDQPAA